METGTPAEPHSYVSDPLNPLNLAPVEPIQASKPSILPPRISPHEEKRSQQTSLKLPLRLHLISNTSTHRLLETRKSRLPCFMLSQFPNADFVGRRSVFDSMDRQLLPRQTPDPQDIQTTRLFALCGMGGIGKTDLAVEYAFSRRSKFGAVFWLEPGGVSQLASDFGRIATQLGLESPDEEVKHRDCQRLADQATEYGR